MPKIEKTNIEDFRDKTLKKVYGGQIDYNDPALAGKHICGACGDIFADDEAYCTHVCRETGARADSVEHQDVMTDGQFSKASEAALKRGEARKADDAQADEAKDTK